MAVRSTHTEFTWVPNQSERNNESPSLFEKVWNNVLPKYGGQFPNNCRVVSGNHPHVTIIWKIFQILWSCSEQPLGRLCMYPFRVRESILMSVCWGYWQVLVNYTTDTGTNHQWLSRPEVIADGEVANKEHGNKRTQKGSPCGLAGKDMCLYPRDLGSRSGWGEIHRKVDFIKAHRICERMVPMSFPTRSRYRLGPGFGLVIDNASVPRSEVECCASNHIHVSYECHNTLLRQMGSGLVVTKWVLINNTKIEKIFLTSK
jgi:hypothetical protein